MDLILPVATIIFLVVPLIEMFLLIEVGSAIGALPTIGLVILTATVGIWLLRLQGLATINRVQEKLQQGIMPETELLEGIMLVIGGALLLTPGFVTDAMGFVCLLPGLRRPLAARIIRSTSFQGFQTHNHFRAGGPTGRNPHRQSPGPGHTIDGEFDAEDEKPGKLEP